MLSDMLVHLLLSPYSKVNDSEFYCMAAEDTGGQGGGASWSVQGDSLGPVSGVSPLSTGYYLSQTRAQIASLQLKPRDLKQLNKEMA